jgi:hypothetical protein
MPLLRPVYTTQLPSGLIVATHEPAHQEPVVQTGPELAPPRRALLLQISAEPASVDNMLLCAPTAADLELPTPTLDDAIELIQDVPFEPAMLLAATLAAEIYHHDRDVQRQLELAAEIFPPALFRRIERFVAEDPSHLVFDLRHVLALQRILIIHAAPDPDPPRGLEVAEIHRVAGAVIAIASSLPVADLPDPEDGKEPDWHAWTLFFAQTGAWYAEPYILEAIARTHTALRAVASSPELADHPARTDVDERLRGAYGLDLAEQLGAGLACAALSKAVDPEVEPAQRAVHLEPGFLANGSLAGREADVVALLSATRPELREALLAAGDTPEQIAWDHSVLERHPFLRLPDGRMRLLSPRALVAWMTRGVHYRLLDAAGDGLPETKAHKERAGFLTFAGALGEGYVRRLTSASLRHATTSGAVRVHGEVEFHIGKNRHDSPDVAVDAGPDVVLIEVYSGRMSLRARTQVDSPALEDFVQRATADKLAELADRTRDLLAGHLRYEGLYLETVERIFPVLVLAGDTTALTPLLWGRLRATTPHAFVDDARVQRPVICDLDDLEPLLALAEEGQHLPDLLARFLRSGSEESPPRNWIAQAYGLERRPSFVEDQYRAAMDEARRTLFPPSESEGSKPRTSR